MTEFWIIVGIVVLLAIFSSSGSSKSSGKGEPPHWICHPHYMDPDNYECSQCHQRFDKESPVCPKCGTKMIGKTEKDENEWYDEEEEWEELFAGIGDFQPVSLSADQVNAIARFPGNGFKPAKLRIRHAG